MKTTNTNRASTAEATAADGLRDTATAIGRAIRTRYLPPTDTKESRVKAWVADDGKPLASVIVSWEYRGTTANEHERAALACLAKARKVSGGNFCPEPVKMIGTYLGGGQYAFALRTLNA